MHEPDHKQRERKCSQQQDRSQQHSVISFIGTVDLTGMGDTNERWEAGKAGEADQWKLRDQ